MTSCSLGFSTINEGENKKGREGFNNQNRVQHKRLNKTIKASRLSGNDKVKNMMNLLHSNNDDSDSQSQLADFNPPPKPISVGSETRSENETNVDEPMTHEHFSAMAEGTYAQQYYDQYVPNKEFENQRDSEN